jgi:hypothetical protein
MSGGHVQHFFRQKNTLKIMLTFALLLLLPLQGSSDPSGQKGDADNGTGAAEGSANGAGHNGGPHEGSGSGGAAAVCEAKPTKFGKCETDKFHPITLRCLDDEVVNHPNGYFFTQNEVCIPSISGAKTHCTKMPAWDGCGEKPGKISFKIPDPFPECKIQQVDLKNLNQSSSYIAAQNQICECQNAAIREIKDFIKDNPVEKDNDVSTVINDLLRLARECRANKITDGNLDCAAENTCKETTDSTGSSAGSSRLAGRSSGVSGEADDGLLPKGPEGRSYGEGGISLATAGTSGSFAKEAPPPTPTPPPENLYFWGDSTVGSGNRAPASADSSGQSGGLPMGRNSSDLQSSGMFGGDRSKDALIEGMGKPDGLSDDIQDALKQKGLSHLTIFQIVHQKYKGKHYYFHVPKE